MYLTENFMKLTEFSNNLRQIKIFNRIYRKNINRVGIYLTEIFILTVLFINLTEMKTFNRILNN